MDEERLPAAEPDVASLIAALDRAVTLDTPRERCLGVKAALVRAASTGEALLPSPCRHPSSESYARHLLHRDPDSRYSVVVMVWGPGQGTQLHDHDGKWCVECVYRGRILVTSYSLGREAGEGLYRFQEESAVPAEIGAAGALIPPHEYHRIENAGADAAITVHVYQGEMTRCNTYEPAGEGLYRRVARALAYTG